jgi:hypothetical protein
MGLGLGILVRAVTDWGGLGPQGISAKNPTGRCGGRRGTIPAMRTENETAHRELIGDRIVEEGQPRGSCPG